MRQFIGLVHKDSDSAYGIEFPDVPGCFSAADTLDDLPSAATQALALWFEDAQMIEPRSLVDIQAETADALRAGAFLMAVPLIALTGRNLKINLSLDAGLVEAIDQTAKARNVNRSALVADTMRREIAG